MPWMSQRFAPSKTWRVAGEFPSLRLCGGRSGQPGAGRLPECRKPLPPSTPSSDRSVWTVGRLPGGRDGHGPSAEPLPSGASRGDSSRHELPDSGPRPRFRRGSRAESVAAEGRTARNERGGLGGASLRSHRRDSPGDGRTDRVGALPVPRGGRNPGRGPLQRIRAQTRISDGLHDRGKRVARGRAARDCQCLRLSAAGGPRFDSPRRLTKPGFSPGGGHGPGGGYSAPMSGRAADWFRQAEADLRHARRSLQDGAHEWACFAAHQAAEKASKAAHEALGREAWGHVVTELLDALRPDVPGIDDSLLDRARALDKLYVPTRYPNGLVSGAPTDFYTRPESERAIADAEAVLAVCRKVLPGK